MRGQGLTGNRQELRLGGCVVARDQRVDYPRQPKGTVVVGFGQLDRHADSVRAGRRARQD